jgi:cytochrome P450
MHTASLPPGPKLSPLDGYLLATGRRDPLSFLLNASRDYGDIVHFRIARQSIYLLNHPDFVKDVLVDNYQKFLKGRGIDRTNRIMGRGLVTSEGSFHRRQRQLINPAFHRQRIAGYGDVMDELSLYIQLQSALVLSPCVQMIEVENGIEDEEVTALSLAAPEGIV